MDFNPDLHNAIISIIDNQIKQNNPPQTKLTLERLINEGWSREDSRKLIGQCVVVEIFNIMKNKEKFNEKRFIENLENLPESPTDK